MKANNLSDNQKVIKIALGETESATFPKKTKHLNAHSSTTSRVRFQNSRLGHA